MTLFYIGIFCNSFCGELYYIVLCLRCYAMLCCVMLFWIKLRCCVVWYWFPLFNVFYVILWCINVSLCYVVLFFYFVLFCYNYVICCYSSCCFVLIYIYLFITSFFHCRYTTVELLDFIVVLHCVYPGIMIISFLFFQLMVIYVQRSISCVSSPSSTIRELILFVVIIVVLPGW